MDLELLVVRRRSGINEDPDASKQRIYPGSAFSLTSVMVYLRHFEDYCNNQAPVNLNQSCADVINTILNRNLQNGS